MKHQEEGLRRFALIQPVDCKVGNQIGVITRQTLSTLRWPTLIGHRVL